MTECLQRRPTRWRDDPCIGDVDAPESVQTISKPLASNVFEPIGAATRAIGVRMPNGTGLFDHLAGSVRAVSAGVDPVGFFTRHADDPHPVRVTFPGLGAVLFFASEAAARELLSLPPDVCIAPIPNPIEPIVGSGSLILQSGPAHRRQRTRLMPAFQAGRVREYAEVVRAVTADQIASLRPGDQLSLRRLSTGIALDTAIRVLFGITDPDRRDAYAATIGALMNANTAPLMLVPSLRRSIGGHGPWARLMTLRDTLDGMLRDDLGTAESDTPDQRRTLLAAGHETTATALTWALYRIHQHGDVRRRLLAELAADPAPAQLTALPYLGAVVKEVLRMHPPVPVVLRRLTSPTRIGQRWMESGQIVGISLYSLHFNAENWRDPHTFDPGRFLDARPSPFRYAPFGGGHRRCIGAALATTELSVAIGTIMTTLDLRAPTVAGRRTPRSTARGIAVTPLREIRLEVVGRRG